MNRIQSEYPIIIFKETIQKIGCSFSFQTEIAKFIISNYDMLSDLKLSQLVNLRNYFNHSFESILFFIIFIEFSKNFKHRLIREFTVFLANIFISKNMKSVTEENFYEFKTKYLKYEKHEFMPEELEILYEKNINEHLFLSHKLILDILKITFETKSKLAKFCEDIGLADFGSEHFREDLSDREKMELKNSMFQMTKNIYDDIQKVFEYLKFAYASELALFELQTDENMKIFYDKIRFYMNLNPEKAFDHLEQIKSSIFLKRLSFKYNFFKTQQDEKIKEVLRREIEIKEDISKIFEKKSDNTFEELYLLSAKRRDLDQIYKKLKALKNSVIDKYIDLSNGKSIHYATLKNII